MPVYLAIMLGLPFNQLGGGGIARFYNISPSSYAPDDADAQLLLAKALRTVLESQEPCHRSPVVANSPAGQLYSAHVTAVLGPISSGLASYRYYAIEALSRVRNIMCRLLGDIPPPSPCAQERPNTTPTRWFCHECKSGPYDISAQTGCTNVINGSQCDHHMCPYCRKE